MMPAYSVLEDNENTGGIIFAKDKRTARKWGANEYADGDEGYVTVTRRRDLDQYEGKGVPAWLLVAQGWHFECHGCGMQIAEYTLEDEGMNAAHVVGKEKGSVYCCHACRMKHLAREAAIKAFGEAFQDMMRDMVVARFGEVEFLTDDLWRNGAYIQRHADPLVVQQARIAFAFPGQKIGGATLEFRHSSDIQGRQIIGPVMPQYFCCAGDKEAFEAWVKETKR